MKTATPKPAMIAAAFVELVSTVVRLYGEAHADDMPLAFSVDARCRPLDPSQNDEAKAYATAWATLDDSLLELAEAAARQMDTVAAMPQSPFAAAAQLAQFQIEYEVAADEYLAALRGWRELDTLTGRVRSAVVERLMWGGLPTHERAGHEPLMAATPADKAASGDPEYTTHKDKTAEASSAKDEAETAMKVALEKVMTARELLRTLVVISATQQPTVAAATGPKGIPA